MSKNTKATQILVIDDEEVVCAAIKKALIIENVELLFAKNGQEGLELLKHNRPVIIILDLKMPQMDGITFLEYIELKPDDEHAVIVMTGHGNDEIMQKCYDLGAHLFLNKPFSLVELLCQVRQLIRLKLLEKEQNNLINKLQQSIDEIQVLRGFLPICCLCKKVSDDEGYWNEIESYIADHSDVKFSHGYCPDCAEKEFSKMREERLEKQNKKTNSL